MAEPIKIECRLDDLANADWKKRAEFASDQEFADYESRCREAQINCELTRFAMQAQRYRGMNGRAFSSVNSNDAAGVCHDSC